MKLCVEAAYPDCSSLATFLLSSDEVSGTATILAVATIGKREEIVS